MRSVKDFKGEPLLAKDDFAPVPIDAFDMLGMHLGLTRDEVRRGGAVGERS